MRDRQPNRRNRPLQVEALESMALLSGVTTLAATVTPSPPIVSPPLPIPIIVALDGKTSGIYTSVTKNPDVGTTYTVDTYGKFNHYGAGIVTGASTPAASSTSQGPGHSK